MSKSTPEARLKKLRKLEANAICPNCGTKAQPGIGFGNVCVKFSTFICDYCKTSHQAISHRVKSITMSNWTHEEVDALCTEHGGGNEAALHIWLQNAPSFGQKYRGGARPREGDKIEVFKKFVEDCYEHGMFRATTPFVPVVPSAGPAASVGRSGAPGSAPSKGSVTATSVGRISPVPNSRPPPDSDPFGNTSPFGSSRNMSSQAPVVATADLLFDAFDEPPVQAAASPFSMDAPFGSAPPPIPPSAAPSSGFDFIATGADDPFAGTGRYQAGSAFDAFSTGSAPSASACASATASPHPSTSGFDFISNSASSTAQPSAVASQQNSAFPSSNDLFGLNAFAANSNDGSPAPQPYSPAPGAHGPAPASDPFGSVFLQPAPLLTPTSSTAATTAATAVAAAASPALVVPAAPTGTGLTSGWQFQQPPQHQLHQHHHHQQQLYPQFSPQPPGTGGPGYRPAIQQSGMGPGMGMGMGPGMGMAASGVPTPMRTAPSPSAMGGGTGMGMGLGVAQSGYKADPISDAFSGLGLSGPSAAAAGKAGRAGTGTATGMGAGMASFDFVQSNMRQQLGGLSPAGQAQQPAGMTARPMGQGIGTTLGQQLQQQQQGFPAMRSPPQPMNMGAGGGMNGGFTSGNPQFPYR